MQYRGGKRQTKHVTLTEATVQKVAQFAEHNGLNFSQAAEYLILIGLQDTKTIGQAAFYRTVVEQGVHRAFDRFAKLIVKSGLEASAAKEAAQQVLFLQLMDVASGLSDHALLERALSVDPDKPMGIELIRLYNKRRGRFRWRAVNTFKKPLAEWSEIVAELGLEDDEG